MRTHSHYFRHAAAKIFFALVGSSFSVFSAQAGTIEHGRELFNLCMGCHSTLPNEHLFGPSLAGVFNRPAGRLKGYEFSDALKTAKFRWNEKNLQQWLEDESKNMVPGTRMEFPGISNPDDVKALIAYLKTLKVK